MPYVVTSICSGMFKCEVVWRTRLRLGVFDLTIVLVPPGQRTQPFLQNISITEVVTSVGPDAQTHHQDHYHLRSFHNRAILSSINQRNSCEDLLLVVQLRRTPCGCYVDIAYERELENLRHWTLGVCNIYVWPSLRVLPHRSYPSTARKSSA
ncbi:hypothetical protein BJV78DRAFT_1209417 [Lactifluus subvellereus]|nr:hypothetical protein BJV78DRAFT_1209417 [Lactifluus subvellereus]